MALSATDTIFEGPGVTSLLQHGSIVIRFEEYGVALHEVVDDVLADGANIGKHPNPDGRRSHDKAAWIGSIM